MVQGWIFFLTLFFFQNFANTFTSRARNSGSLKRHVKASLLSNTVWIVGQTVILGSMFDNFTGKNGLAVQVATVVSYTAVTTVGSIAAHFWALHTEKGKEAVGASKLYAQVPVAEYAELQAMLREHKATVKVQIAREGIDAN